MSTSARHDAWGVGDRYDAYMGRWSRGVAPGFLDWLGMAAGLDWLEVGCGTGALSGAILASCAPRSLLAIDPSEGFLARARENVPDPRATFATGGAEAVPAPTAGRDVVVSGLVLNFVPDREKALEEMRRVARAGATIGFYVWDYPGRGVAFMRAFWEAAVALDPSARDLMEDQRFPFCTESDLVGLARRVGLAAVSSTAIEIATTFADFDDFWTPFTLGAGPAPGYCMSLDAAAQQTLMERLRLTLPRAADGTIPLTARAWAVKGIAP